MYKATMEGVMKKGVPSVVLGEGQSASLKAGGVGERRVWGS